MPTRTSARYTLRLMADRVAVFLPVFSSLRFLGPSRKSPVILWSFF